MEKAGVFVLWRRPRIEEVDGASMVELLGEGEAKKKICHCCLDSNENILNMRATQSHSGGNNVDLSLQDNVEIPCNWTDYS